MVDGDTNCYIHVKYIFISRHWLYYINIIFSYYLLDTHVHFTSETETHLYNDLADHNALHLLQPLANPHNAEPPQALAIRRSPCSRSSSLFAPPRAAQPRACDAAGQLRRASVRRHGQLCRGMQPRQVPVLWGWRQVKVRSGRRRLRILLSHKAL
jgi:hypothetical protein